MMSFITIAPYFPEYKVFVNAAGARLVEVPADTEHFQIDFDALEERINAHTRGVIINSPTTHPAQSILRRPSKGSQTSLRKSLRR